MGIKKNYVVVWTGEGVRKETMLLTCRKDSAAQGRRR